jgi:hypothetical protein
VLCIVYCLSTYTCDLEHQCRKANPALHELDKAAWQIQNRKRAGNPIGSDLEDGSSDQSYNESEVDVSEADSQSDGEEALSEHMAAYRAVLEYSDKLQRQGFPKHVYQTWLRRPEMAVRNLGSELDRIETGKERYLWLTAHKRGRDQKWRGSVGMLWEQEQMLWNDRFSHRGGYSNPKKYGPALLSATCCDCLCAGRSEQVHPTDYTRAEKLQAVEQKRERLELLAKENKKMNAAHEKENAKRHEARRIADAQRQAEEQTKIALEIEAEEHEHADDLQRIAEILQGLGRPPNSFAGAINRGRKSKSVRYAVSARRPLCEYMIRRRNSEERAAKIENELINQFNVEHNNRFGVKPTLAESTYFIRVQHCFRLAYKHI